MIEELGVKISEKVEQVCGRGGNWGIARGQTDLEWCLPELSRFFGIVIRMFAELGSPHHVPHFHAYYQEDVGIFSFDPVEMIAGSLQMRQGG